MLGLIIFIVAGIVLGLGVATAVMALRYGQHRQEATYDTDRYGRRTRLTEGRPDTRTGGLFIAGLFIVLGAFILTLDSFTVVGPREVAVRTAFGKVVGHPLGSGWHWMPPWHNVELFDASVQTLKFYQGERGDDGDCVTVRLGNSTPACVDVTLQWSIDYRGDVNELYLKYRTFDNVHDNLVRRQLGSALNEVFGDYDPLAAVGLSADSSPAASTRSLQGKVKTALQRDLGSAILVDSVTIPIVHFDADTEGRLRAFQQAKADTRIAEQAKLTARAQADAAQLLADQPGVEKGGVQYQNCLNTIKDLAQRDQLKNLPMTFNCDRGGTFDSYLLQDR